MRALAALRTRAEALGLPPSRCVCTGDVVAYCVEPEETTAAIRSWGCLVVAGNCEEQLAQAAADCACGFEEGSECDRLAKGWYPFANERISPASRAWMAGLPKTLTFRMGGLTFRVIHGGVRQVNRFVFASEREALVEEVAWAGTDVIIAGHSGLPFIEKIGIEKIGIEKVGQGVWFNPGVIGMPANDGTPDVWYGLIGVQEGQVVLSTHRLAYDHIAAAGAMRRFGHANGYARSLVTGLWPSLDVLPPTEKAAAGKKIRPRTLRVPVRAQVAAAI
jgi:predicted phosphodiesterase